MNNPFCSLRLRLIGAALFASLVSSACGNKPAADAKSVPPTLVKLQTVESSRVEDAAEFVGSLEALKKVELKPEIQGRIVDIAVSNGDRVNQGSLLIQLSPDQERTGVDTAIASASSIRAGLGTAQANFSKAKADRDKAIANLALQKSNYERSRSLVAEGAQARIQLDTAQRDLASAVADVRAQEEGVRAAQAAIVQAQAAIRGAEASIESASVPLQYKQVRAPITGVIGEVVVKTGDYVNVGQTLTTITQNDSLDLKISVPVIRSAQLRQGLRVQLLDANSNKPLTIGRLYFISPQVASGVQTILTKARFPNANGALRDGQFVKARITWESKPGVLVPTSAVSRIGGKPFVFVAEEDTSKGEPQQIVRQRSVQLGDVQGQSYQVIDGIKAGEQVAVSGILRLKEGAPIKPQS